MASKNVLIWIAGLISCDGNIYRFKTSRCCSITIASKEKDWILKIQKRVQQIGLKGTIYKRKIIDNKWFYTLRLSPTIKVYYELSKVKKWMMLRKYQLLEKTYGDVADIENRIKCYEESMKLRKSEKLVGKKRQIGFSDKLKALAKKYNLPYGTVHWWIYSHQKPNVFRVGLKK